MENSQGQATQLVYFFTEQKRLGRQIVWAIFLMNICERGPPRIAERRIAVVYGIGKTIFFPNLKENRQYAKSGECHFPVFTRPAQTCYIFPLLVQSLHNLRVIVSLNPILQTYAKECFPSHMFPVCLVCLCLCVRKFVK